ncbi:MAG: D-tyrosyl-tRNA(Tyr) deacylase [Candidatus Kapabacteria bacterium]|nr:D-tyrosyl-tRNA(Tyr) deacylase [Candidatus Kapabacteria bacterium]
MRALIQRVSTAHVEVDSQTVGSIGQGLVALIGITHTDTIAECAWIVEKILSLRVFADDDGKMNLSVGDVGGGVLLVSQFTLYGDLAKGTRPSFIRAAGGDVARPMFDQLVEMMKQRAKEQKTPVTVATGVFGAMMNVHLVNDGPVTIMLER